MNGYVILGIIIFAVFLGIAGGVSRGQGLLSKKPTRIVLAIGLVAAVAGPFAFYRSLQEPSAKYDVRVVGFKVLPGQYVRTWFFVTNVGKASGNPDCTVTIQPRDSYGDSLGNGGFNGGSLGRELKPRQRAGLRMDVLVSGDDASKVTSKSMIKVSCQ